MIPLGEFLAELARQDITLWADGGKLRCSGPDHVMTSELQAELAARKSELLALLARATPPREAARVDLVRMPREGGLPLSYGQERILSLTEIHPASSVYNVPTIFRLEGALDVAVLERSLGELRRRHETLRTAFPTFHGRPEQRIAAPGRWSLPVLDDAGELGRLPPDRRDRELWRLLEAEARQPFDLEAGPAWRARLFRLGEREHVLSVTVHHIIFDGRSKVVLLTELGLLYKALLAGAPAELAKLDVQYADYACWERQRLQAEMEPQLAYWKHQLGGAVPELRIPRDRPKSPTTTSRGLSRTFDVPDPVAGSLSALSRREQASLFMTLLAAFGAWLHRYTEQQDQAVCSPVACRDRVELEGLIGYFNNIVVVRSDLSGDPTFRELIGRVRRVALEAHAHHTLPFQKVAELPNLVRTPLTRGMFSYQDMSSRTLDLPGIIATPLDLRGGPADFDLALYLESTSEGKLSGLLEYPGDLFEEETVSLMLQNLQLVLASVAEDPDRRLSDLPQCGRGLGEAERLLASHPQITKALVVHGRHHPGPVAYLVLNEDDIPSLEEIRRFVKARVPDYLVPVAFVPLDEIPLTADGAVDRMALPPPRLAGRPEGTYAAPRTALERQLAEIWQRVLWLDQEVGIHDHFLDLGGHSLLSVQLMAELKKAWPRPLPTEALLGWSTVAELARILEQKEGPTALARPPAAELARPGFPAPRITQEILRGLRAYTASWKGQRPTPGSLIVGFNTTGSEQALFWCLQRYGELTQMAKYLGPDQPVYGMRSGNRVMVKTETNNRALAAHYVGEVLAVQPKGPFRVGGNCQAASIAFHIARNLMDAGHEISLLFLMERFVAQPYPGRVALLFGAESDRNPYLRFHQPELGWRKYYARVSVDPISGVHGEFFREPNIQVLTKTLRRLMDEARRAASEPPPAEFRDGLQRLPESAYRVRLTAPESWTAQPGAEVGIPVAVTNRSPDTWRSTEASGIFLANRWLSPNGRVIEPLDGRSRLSRDLEPGSTAQLELMVRVPMKSGEYVLELDLVDEGVAWFKDRGSEATRLRMNVPGRPSRGLLARLPTIRDEFRRRPDA